MSNTSKDLALKLNPLRPFAERIATVRSPTEHLYSYFLSASFVRAFEFVDLAAEQKSENAFFRGLYTLAPRGKLRTRGLNFRGSDSELRRITRNEQGAIER